MSLNLKGWKLKTLPSAHVHFLKSASLLSPIAISSAAQLVIFVLRLFTFSQKIGFCNSVWGVWPPVVYS
jgi:hypothetical protein